MAELRAVWLGRREYEATWRLQNAAAASVREGAAERLLLVEHDPVYTVGRSGSRANLLVPAEDLAREGIAVHDVDRGGDITYHGPGQVVGYPVLSLGFGPDLPAYVRTLEGALRAVLASYGVPSRAIAGKTGVWVAEAGGYAKIAAIGVRVARGVSTHGFALNVATDPAAFARMIPCGFAHDVTSLDALGVRAPLTEVAARCAGSLAGRLGRDLVWEDAGALVA
ncbi:MAG: lipoyl(octanoyl) transferase LipB [Chloroflexi bacterium]|nr:lipoyl(octanoyl) transferase LipB [Chloroflexota bacterium]